MTPLITLLKTCIALYPSECGIKEGILRRERGINDFLIDASEQNWDTAKELACRFLTNCCRERNLLDQVICLIAIAFLDRALRISQPTEALVYERLRECLDAALGTYEECCQWADKWWP